MAKSPKDNVYDEDGAPLTDAELKRMRPMREVDPALCADYKAGRINYGGRPQGRTKEAINLSLDLDLIQALRQSGRGWQTRANTMLRRGMKLPLRQRKTATAIKKKRVTGR